MARDAIRIRGARTHNLADFDLDLPRGAWTVVCGVSGSGKSSLVLDTLGAESRRRFLSTLERTARTPPVERPDVDAIEGLPPAVVAGFLARSPGSRHTLGTLTEVTHALRALFARAAVPHCPVCDRTLLVSDRETIARDLIARPAGTRVVLLAPRGRGPDALAEALRQGFVRVRVGRGPVTRIEDTPAPGDDDTVEVVVDRLVAKTGAEDRFRASVEQGLGLGGGVLRAVVGRDGEERTFADRPFCGEGHGTWPRLSPSLFSFDSPHGACPRCEGRGTVERRGAVVRCPDCAGRRLAPFPRAARLAGRTFGELEDRTVEELARWLDAFQPEGPAAVLCAPAREDASSRLRFLWEVGLGYLQPSRPASTLSGGELHRARLAAACAARMSGLLYLLDEPTAGLHPVERPPLRQRLRRLVDEGNTVVVVEHDPETIQAADHVVELGPGAGVEGGHVLDAGPRAEVVARARAPIVRALLAGTPPLRQRARADGEVLVLRGASFRNLAGFDCTFPLGAVTAITGRSGSGKSTLLLDVLAPVLRAAVEGTARPTGRAAALEGAAAVRRVGVARPRASRHRRATPGSVLGTLKGVQRFFAATLEARARGWGPSRFSRHVKGGRCEACKGLGDRPVALRDLGPMRVPCDACDATGFAPDTLKVRVKGLSIADVMALPLSRAAEVFRDLPSVARPLEAATEVGLGYVPLGEPTSRLSGGEALRLRLASALGRRGEGHAAYLLDEPSAGLHPDDVGHLARVLRGLGGAGHLVVLVEHHPALVAAADHVVELGPGPGEDGGRLLYEGPPAGLLDVAASPTGAWFAGRCGDTALEPAPPHR